MRTPSPAPVVLPKVSVVVPTYRRPVSLRRALEALGRQDPPPHEVIVAVFDEADRAPAEAGSTRLVTSRRKGAGAQRNAGWQAATGELIAFTDDDCVVEPGWLGALTAPFSDPSVGLVQGTTLPLEPPGRMTRGMAVSTETGLYESCNIAYRRAALCEVEGFDETFPDRFSGRPFGEDADLAWRVKRRGWSSRFVPEAVVHHEVVPGGLRELVKEEWRRGMFPGLVAAVPELRSQLPWGGWMLRRQSPWAQLALVGSILSVAAPGPGLVLALPYCVWLRGLRADHIPFQVVRDLVGSVALAVGSVRARTLLL